MSNKWASPVDLGGYGITGLGGTFGLTNALNGALGDARYLQLTGGTLTGPALFPLGSAAAPTHSFAGDADTGMYASAANTLAWAVGGINAMRLDAAVLNLPNSRIQARVADGLLSALFSGVTRGVRVVHSSLGTSIEGVDATGVGSFERLVLNGSDLLLQSGAANRLYIAPSGNVSIGLGAVAGAQALDVGGAIQSTRNFAETRMLTANGFGWRWGSLATGTTSGNMYFQSTTNGFSGGTTGLEITPAGSVSIGAGASPNGRLHVATADGVQAAIIAGASFAVRVNSVAGVGAYIEGVDSTGVASFQPLILNGSDLRLASGGAERARLTASGFFGVATIPAAVMHAGKISGVATSLVGDDTTLTTNAQNGIRLAALNDGSVYIDAKTTAGGALFLRSGGGAEAGSARTWLTVLPTSGDAGFGVIPSTKLHVNGPIRKATYTVATLPAAATVGVGTETFATDSNTTLAAGHGNIVAAGGANLVPVYSDGTNWRIG